MNRSSANPQRPKIIQSTSFYLQEKARELKTGKHLSQVLDEIHLEGNHALFIPSSNFRNSKDLVKTYHDSYLSQLTEQEAQQLADAYMQELQQAQKDRRYFGRHESEIRRNFKNDENKAAIALASFLSDHGFISSLPEEQARELLNYYDIDSRVRHRTDGFFTSGENKG